MPKVDLLLLAAFAPELAPLRTLLGNDLVATHAGLSIMGKTVGVGLPNATAGTMKRIGQLEPRAVVLLGTAGVYPSTLAMPAIGDAVVVRRAVLVEPAEIEARSAIPEPMSLACDLHAMMSAGLALGRAPQHDVANTIGVTTDDALARTIGAASGCALENLEAFGVATACALTGVPLACVLGVSNLVGATGRDEWRNHHKRASQAAAEIVSRWLVAGAMGLPHG